MSVDATSGWSRGVGTRPRIAAASHVPTALLVAGGLVVPNLALAILGIRYGVPPRTVGIALYALLALLCARLRWYALIPLVLAASLFDAAMAVCRAFFLDPTDLPELTEMLRTVDLFSSGFYALLICGFALQLTATVAFLVRYGPPMARGNRAVFGLACLAALSGDILLNGSVAYDVGPVASVGRPFESGVENSGFAERAARSGRPGERPPVLLVVVEALGVLRDPAARAALLSPFDDPALRARYDVALGTSSFFGATSYGEMRELCGSRDSYRSLWDEHPACLPRRLAERGYRSVAVHGFKRTFYDRDQWYPRAGFAHALFRDDLAPGGHYRCRGPFPGPCDAEVAARVADALAAPGRPNFVYWMTLSSHIPVQTGTATPRFGCAADTVFHDPSVCALAEIWADLFEAVAGIARARPGTEILLVGDHAPPLWRRAARAQFLPDRVQWISLSPRRSAEAPAREARAEGP